ncbi:PREDICTED: uncharacterized protein LOC105140066 [Populus euphratica]|uniref:Uncharacterized protein LOC105140066 n=1 Tax=Populus euphratica TaxID=75702 RepID=A0AAJ6VAX4_POPEU|nr:PREDICTED: uncharacterized protein LOC105140066 [Populus euphratica]
MIDEWCKEAPKELDFNHEAENTRTVSQNLGCTSKYDSNKPINQVDVLIPEVIQGDHVALLSSFSEMGLKLRLDFPEQAMDFISVFFRTSTSASEAAEYAKSLGEQRARNMKVLQEKMNLSQKEVKRFNPIDAFPGDMVIFSRVIGLLRRLSTTLDAHIVYHDTMRPFAESVLQEKIAEGPSENAQWINDTPVDSDVEAKPRQILVELGNNDKILGIQVCMVPFFSDKVA